MCDSLWHCMDTQNWRNQHVIDKIIINTIKTKNQYSTVALVEQTIAVRLGRYTFGTGIFSFFFTDTHTHTLSGGKLSFFTCCTTNSRLHDFEPNRIKMRNTNITRGKLQIKNSRSSVHCCF